VATLKIEWKDNIGQSGGTLLTIEVDGEKILDEHYPRRRLDEARKAAKRAVQKAEFDNKKKSTPEV
jgi:hypothetical protein